MHDSLRSFIQALEQAGQLVRIPQADQDRYEATSIMYNLIDDKSVTRSPAVLFEKTRTRGKWYRDPVIGNLFGNPVAEAIAFDRSFHAGNYEQTHYETVDAIKQVLAHKDRSCQSLRQIPTADAPCKNVILEGADADLLKFPWLQTNPADAGPYINAGCLVLQDKEFGGNIGVYRMQVKSGGRIGVNAGFGQDAWRILQAMKKRGDTAAPAAVIISPPPIIWSMASVKVGGPGESEYDLAGLFTEDGIEVVPCETSDLLVPAHAEMIVEGEIPLNESEEEGPFGEFLGFLGPKKPDNFFMNVRAITHRHDPWYFNAFSGITFDMPRTLWTAVDELTYGQSHKAFRRLFRLTPFVMAVQIEKSAAGQGMEVGRLVAEKDDYAKIVIVVDSDINIQNPDQVLGALGGMWQPTSATQIIDEIDGGVGDPSVIRKGKTSKIVIDATRQRPDEGGPQVFAATNRSFIEHDHPEIIEEMHAKWGHLWDDN